MQERISGWLARYDFAAPIRDYLWRNAMSHLGKETIIALDSSDISKEFGGEGMEGMEKGYDASRDTTAMGHNILCASLVLQRRALPLCLDLLKGRHGLPKAEQDLFHRIAQSTQGKGIVVCDRGFDSEPFLRTVIRIKYLHRDLFGTTLPIDRAMKSAPATNATLSSPTNQISATIRWRPGFFPSGETHLPVLVVSSTFNGTTLYLYATNFIHGDWTDETMRKAAILAANAYYNRWQIEVLFQDLKGAFAIEQARVRLLVSNIRTLLTLTHPRYITGRPRKEKPPDPTPFLPNFSC